MNDHHSGERDRAGLRLEERAIVALALFRFQLALRGVSLFRPGIEAPYTYGADEDHPENAEQICAHIPTALPLSRPPA